MFFLLAAPPVGDDYVDVSAHVGVNEVVDPGIVTFGTGAAADYIVDRHGHINQVEGAGLKSVIAGDIVVDVVSDVAFLDRKSQGSFNNITNCSVQVCGLH